MSRAHDLLMLGPVGTPLEDAVFGVDFESAPQLQMSREDQRRYLQLSGDSFFHLDGEQWTVEEIEGVVYTFALDDWWEAEDQRQWEAAKERARRLK